LADHDLVVIGAGAAGLSVANVAARLGLAVTLVEQGEMGGECLNTGCVPSKALLACAHAAGAAREAGRFGVRLPPPEIDWRGVRAHVRGAIAAIAPVDSAERYRGLGCEVLRGRARLVGPRAVAIDGRVMTARRIVLAVGSRPAIPPLPGLDGVPYLTNETVFQLEERPAHLLILGAGAMGVEMAQAFALLGARVTLIARDRVLPGVDEDLAAPLRDQLVAAGVAVWEGADAVAAENGPALRFRDGRHVSGTHLLVATGRRTALDGLGLDAAGIASTAQGIETDLGLRSVTNRRVWAVGDCADPRGAGPRRFTHVASQHAGVVVRGALFGLPARLSYAALPRVVYTEPELAWVGLTEAEARARGRARTVLQAPLAENDRAIAEGRRAGLAKIIVDHRGRIVGAGALAPAAGEMAAALSVLIGRRGGARVLASLVVAYPTRFEVVKRACSALFTPALFGPGPRLAARLFARIP
jgi:pyruvate/2-oxoglutarate dehydrogenase complex dihydrolipoamide dehydrogenase (E3) component